MHYCLWPRGTTTNFALFSTLSNLNLIVYPKEMFANKLFEKVLIGALSFFQTFVINCDYQNTTIYFKIKVFCIRFI